MGKFDGILFCTDFDGTLAYEAKVSRENAEAIRYFQSEGGLFSPATGRPAPFLHQYAESFIPNAPMVTLNGAQIVQYAEAPMEDKILYEGFVPYEIACRATLEMSTHPRMMAFRYYYEDHVHRLHLNGSDVEARLADIPKKIHKMIFHHDTTDREGVTALLRERYGSEMNFSSSWASGIEGLSVQDSKGNAALRVKEMTGAHTLVCAGDYENDISMLRVADIGYAVGNALDVVKAVADRLTVRCEEHAIAAIIAELERELSV